MTTNLSQAVNSTIDTAIASASLSALATGGYAITTAGSEINNVPTSGSVVSYDMADLTITLSSAVTAGTGSPTIVVWVLPSVDGTNYPTPPGSTAAAAPPGLSYTFQQVPGVSTSTIVCPNIPIGPYKFRVMIQNNLGVAFPTSTTSTCKLQRRNMQMW